jgi:hypothetical protein
VLAFASAVCVESRLIVSLNQNLVIPANLPLLPLQLPLLPLLRSLLLQILHMTLVVVHLLLVCRNVAFSVAGQVLTPSSLALFLFLQLFLLGLFELFGRAICVFLDAEGAGGGEGTPRGEGQRAEGGEEGAGRHCCGNCVGIKVGGRVDGWTGEWYDKVVGARLFECDVRR